MELIAQRTSQVRADPPAPMALRRRGRALQVWLDALDRYAQLPEGSTYRSGAGFEREQVVDLLSLDTPPELRAAAVYVLLERGKAGLTAAIPDSIGPASPPLVLLLASLAPGGAELVDAEALGRAPYPSRPNSHALRECDLPQTWLASRSA